MQYTKFCNHLDQIKLEYLVNKGTFQELVDKIEDAILANNSAWAKGFRQTEGGGASGRDQAHPVKQRRPKV